LTGGGKDFIERIGVEATRRVIHHVMMGENLRQQTEPLTRRRVAQISGAKEMTEAEEQIAPFEDEE